MTRDVITVKPQDYLSDAAELMYKNCIHRVFVVKDNKLVGVLSSFDFVTPYACNRLIAGHITPRLRSTFSRLYITNVLDRHVDLVSIQNRRER